MTIDTSFDARPPADVATLRIDTTTTTYVDEQAVTRSEQAAFRSDEGVEFSVINVHPEAQYQTIRGFGGAITEASGHTLDRMSPERQEEVLEAYFGETGNRYTVVRTHVDSSDFSLGTYEAVPDDDPSLASFSLERDEKYILPFVLRAQEKAGAPLEVMLSPWSPPAYMKTNGSRLHGGSLKPEYREQWARYLAHYVTSYLERGAQVTRLSVQNEPEASQNWDSCRFTAEEEKTFVRDFLHPALIEAGHEGVGIHIWDHNKERMYERAVQIIDDETASMVSGVAFHWYTGDHFDALRLVRERFPNLDLVFSEGCVEYSRFDADQLTNAQMYAHDIIGNLNGGMNTFIDWNIVLDEQGGPNHVDNFCDAPIMCDTVEDTIEVKLSHTYIGHFSRFIAPGAHRVATSSFTSRLEVTAAQNVDGTLAVVVMNPTDEEMMAFIRVAGQVAPITAPAGSISTSVVTGL